jgi:hypothetical protein
MYSTDPRPLPIAGSLMQLLPENGGFRVGAFLVDSAGGLAPHDPDRPANFRCHWRERPVRVALERDLLSLTVELGRVPSSVSSGSDLRQSVFSALRGLPATLPDSWELDLLPDHRVRIGVIIQLPPPVTAAAMMISVTHFLLTLAPYLDLLEEVGVADPGGSTAAGTANTWPG